MIKRLFSRQRNQDVRVKETDERNGGLKIGYARVSTVEQNLASQIDRLTLDGCDQIFEDKGLSGAREDRPGLTQALSTLSEGDTFVVTKLDRLGRSLTHLITLLDDLKERGIAFRSIDDSIDTSTASGKLHFTMIAALAEFERGLISERTKAGLAAARARGVKFGRKPKLTYAQALMAKELIDGKDGKPRTRKEVAKSFLVSEPTLRRALRAYELDE